MPQMNKGGKFIFGHLARVVVGLTVNLDCIGQLMKSLNTAFSFAPPSILFWLNKARQLYMDF